MLWSRPRKKYPFAERKAEDWSYQYSSSRGSRLSARRINWFTRLTLAVAIFTLLIIAREAPYPAGEQVREGLRFILTTEWNFQPVVQKVVQLGLQMVNVDRPFNGEIPPGTRQAMGPAGTAEALEVPVSGRVVRGFGWSLDPLDNLERFHPGLDIAAPAGTPVKAARQGRVVKEGEDPSLGKFVLLDHGEGCYTLYGGLGRVQVTRGEQVASGQVLGEVGSKADFPGGGLHFELREKGRLIDPMDRLQLSRER